MTSVTARIVRYRPPGVAGEEVLTVAVSPENGVHTARWVDAPTRDSIKLNLEGALQDALLDMHPTHTNDDDRERLLGAVLHQLADMRAAKKRVPSPLRR